MKSWVVFSRPSDSRWPPEDTVYTKPISVHNFVLDWAIDLIFFSQYSGSHPLQEDLTGNHRKLPEITENGRKSPKMAKNRQKHRTGLRYWLQFLCLHPPKVVARGIMFLICPSMHASMRLCVHASLKPCGHDISKVSWCIFTKLDMGNHHEG